MRDPCLEYCRFRIYADEQEDIADQEGVTQFSSSRVNRRRKCEQWLSHLRRQFSARTLQVSLLSRATSGTNRTLLERSWVPLNHEELPESGSFTSAMLSSEASRVPTPSSSVVCLGEARVHLSDTVQVVNEMSISRVCVCWGKGLSFNRVSMRQLGRAQCSNRSHHQLCPWAKVPNVTECCPASNLQNKQTLRPSGVANGRTYATFNHTNKQASERAREQTK